MSLNQSFNCYQTHQRQNLVSAKSSSLELVPEITSNLEIYTTEALRRIQEELDWYRNLYDQNPGINFTVDSAGMILSVNQFGAKRLGYLPPDLHQTLIFNIFAFFEREKLSDLFTRLLNNSSEKVEDGEFCLNCPDSQIIWLKIKARKLLDRQQNPIILIDCEDITAYKLAQASNLKENSFLELAARIPVMLWMTDDKGVHNFFNSCWLKLTGRKIEQELGLGWLDNLHLEDKNAYLSTYFQAIKQKEKFQIQYRLKSADGDYRWISDKGVPRFSSDNEFIGYIGCCIDITECKKAEVAIRESQIAAQAQLEEMESLNRLKDEFLSTVSHELRTPLTNMKMAIQMLGIKLEKEHLPSDTSQSVNYFNNHSKISRYFEILNNECEREINLINNFLDLQRLDTNAKPLVLEKIEVSQWLERVIELYNTRNRNCCRQRLKLEMESHLPSIICDPFSLERILVELLTNACKFSPINQEIIVKAQIKSDNIQFQVINTGAEIPTAELPRIFDKFYRIPSNDPWKQGGTGLGLALVQKLTKHLDGFIEVESGSNRTIFSIQLPLER
ncbi:PAS domain-containing sensor histidine kinase [Plectonema cf. radiosum LEGE 06105]|uniref:histidine kinase n=1 Tax=Plectonema cf. radiosum LEGE 06105 TaxID=945769 RepID=A0A8J7F119_9CYAN|nr:PAS domain-containing sensor histidine kinase [Plectonema radiosum]MBE9213958.1 PAS domain-containing sensor histidine kinase [Plectonema cf. radiosum LEGE 06105]